MTVSTDTRTLYLDLLKKTLSFTLWPEPGRVSPAQRVIDEERLRYLRAGRFEPPPMVDVTPQDRDEGRIWPALAHTMIGLRRLENLQHCIESVLADGVPGDLIETGVWRGGASIFMRGVLAAYGVPDRKVFLADSFRGLPVPDPVRYPADADDRLHEIDYLRVSRGEVEQNFRSYGLLDEQVVFLEGWFRDTLPVAPIETLAVLRLDGDMYESTMDALTNLYSKLSPGGYCIIDDYSISACAAAVHDFRRAQSIDEPLLPIDPSSVHWRKRRAAA